MAERKTARIVWKGSDLNFRVIGGSGYEFDAGNPSGPAGGSPMEILLGAMAACTAMDVADILRKMRQPVTGVEIEAAGLRAENHPKVYTEVDLVYVVRGQGVPARAVENAIELSQVKYCSASAMFRAAGVQLRTSYRIENPLP